ncbi:hypothetical protein FQZ97_880810 [compost metagenome]
MPAGVWYSQIASNASAPTATVRTRSGRQNQPNQIIEGTAPIRMPFSYPSMAALYWVNATRPPATISTANSQSHTLRRAK